MKTLLLIAMTLYSAISAAEVQQKKKLDAGPDQTIIAGEAAHLRGKSVGVNNYHWTTNGTGTFANPNLLTTKYFPSEADIANGQIFLTLSSGKGKKRISDSMGLKIKPKKSLNAGPDQTITAGAAAHLTGTSVGVHTYRWKTSGTGTFSNPTLLVTDYFPSQADITSGQVQLTLTDGKNKVKISDAMNLYIQNCGTVNAGPDIVTCGYQSGGELYLSATVTNYESITWSTSGYGNFDDVHSLTPTYYYDATDVNIANIEIAVTIQSASCTDTDTVSVYFQAAPHLEFPEPYVQEFGYSGVTATVYMYGYASSGTWTTSGSGSFSDPSATVTAYYPSTEDRINGCAELTFTSNDPDGDCPAASGSMSACFTPIVECPSLYIGEDMTICAAYGGGEQIYLSASVSGNADGIYWSSTGAGYFDDPYSLNPVYTVDGSDVNNAQIEIYATIGQYDCNVSDAMTVYINSAPELVFPEPYVYTCAGTSVYVNVYLYGYASGGTWSSTGSGSFDDASSTYTAYHPAPDEVGSVTFTFITNDPDGPCGSTSGSMEAYFEDCGSGGETARSANAVSLYPNPAKNEMELKTTLKTKKSETYITDVMGSRVDFRWNGDVLDISGLSKGPHILHVTSEEGKNYHIRFLKL
jgi:hypothetical protein